MPVPPTASLPAPASSPPLMAGAGGAAAPKPQPPFGSTPAVTPGQNQGMQVAGMMKVGTALKFLVDALQAYGATSPEGEAITKAVSALQKLAKPGSVSPAGEANQLQKAQFQNAQNASLMQATKGMDQGQAGAGAPPPSPPQGM